MPCLRTLRCGHLQEGDAYEFATPVDILGALGKAQCQVLQGQGLARSLPPDSIACAYPPYWQLAPS